MSFIHCTAKMLAANIVVATMLMRKPPRTLRARRPHQTGCSLGISNASTPNRMHCSLNYFFHLPCFCSSHCQSPNSPCSKSGTFSPIDNLSLIYLSLGGEKNAYGVPTTRQSFSSIHMALFSSPYAVPTCRPQCLHLEYAGTPHSPPLQLQMQQGLSKHMFDYATTLL